MAVTNMKGAGLILLAALVLGLGVNALSPKRIPLIGQWDPAKGVVMADPGKYSHQKVEELNNPLKLLRMIQAGHVVLIDARIEQAFAQGHLPGAQNLPLHAFDENLSTLRRVVKPGLPVVVYCSGVECQDSHKFASRLAAMGVGQVMVYSGGFKEWSEMGLEVKTDAP